MHDVPSAPRAAHYFIRYPSFAVDFGLLPVQVKTAIPNKNIPIVISRPVQTLKYRFAKSKTARKWLRKMRVIWGFNRNQDVLRQ